MAALDLDQAEFLFHCDGLSDVALHVFHFTGSEALSRPFEFHIELISDKADLDLEAPIGKGACLTLRGRLYDGSRYERFVCGVVERFVELSAGVRRSRYLAVLVPEVKLLQYTRNARVFQKLSSPQVAEKVLKDGKISADRIQTLLHGSYGPRDYCVQYQESDLNFVQRLLEEEGIFYFFEHKKAQDTLILGDGNHAFDVLPRYDKIVVRDLPHHYEEGLTELQAESTLRPGATLLRDFKFKQPALDLEAKAEAAQFADYKMYFFPGEYTDPALGRRLAELRLQEQQCQRSRYVGTGNVRALVPGYRFTLSGHRRADCNKEYLIVEVKHEGTQPQALRESAAGVEKTVYRNCLQAIPSAVPFRPARLSEVPSIAGVQTAVVVGPPGEEIHCDSHGRVKVQFHWDREGKKDDHSSCWIRVSQPFSGAGQGGMFIPRVGQEVVVQFLEGDPDRPLIVGRVYNGENSVPHDLPAAKNVSTLRSASTPGGEGFNELRFDDSKGKEQIFIHAQKDLEQVVGNDLSTKVARDRTSTVGGVQAEVITGNQTVEVLEGEQRIAVLQQSSALTVKKDRSVTVQTGDHLLAVQAGSSLTSVFGQCRTEVKKGNSELSVHSGGHITQADKTVHVESRSADLQLHAKGPWVGKSEADLRLVAAEIKQDANEITLSALRKITLMVGPSSLTIDPSGVSISGPEVSSTALGTQTISGALVRIN